jgi:hypothetical protein
MRIQSIKPNSGERFACSESDVRAVFDSTAVKSVGFGRPTRSFLTSRWNARYSPQPKFTGPVVAALKTHPESELTRYRKLLQYGRGGELYFYPVGRTEYPEEASEEFTVKVMPMMRSWFDGEISKSETQFQAKTLVVEWTGNSHKTHQFRII